MADIAHSAPAPSTGDPATLPLSEKSASTVFASFLSAIEQATGLRVCIYDLAFFLKSPKLQLTHQLQIHDCPFCHHVKRHPECFRACMATENERTTMAAAADGPILHTCHAGVTDLIYPIRVRGALVGAVFIGQVSTQDPASLRRKLLQLRRKYDFAIDGLEQAAASLPQIDPESLHRQAPILTGIADYLEQSVELDKLRAELESLRRGPGFYPTQIGGDVRTLPTPVIDRLRSHLTGSEPVAIAKALDVLKTRYWKNPTARSVAHKAGMSEFHFSRSFRKATGTTFRQCLLESRLTAAFYLLKGSRFTIEQSALAVGYDSGPSLQRAFKGFTGQTPHAFLRTYPRADCLEQVGERPAPKSPQKLPGGSQ